LSPQPPPSQPQQLPRPPRLMPAGEAAGGPRRSAASPSARLSEAHLRDPIMPIRITATPTLPLPFTPMAIPPTAMAIRRTTATAIAIISATTAHVTSARRPSYGARRVGTIAGGPLVPE